jgi:hypothetical protein
MITEWLVAVGAAVMAWVASLLPDWEVPSQIANVDDQINGFFGLFNGFGVWVDWVYIGLVCGIPLSIWGIGLLASTVQRGMNGGRG